jgi:hypothetical protein
LVAKAFDPLLSQGPRHVSEVAGMKLQQTFVNVEFLEVGADVDWNFFALWRDFVKGELSPNI